MMLHNALYTNSSCFALPYVCIPIPIHVHVRVRACVKYRESGLSIHSGGEVGGCGANGSPEAVCRWGSPLERH